MNTPDKFTAVSPFLHPEPGGAGFLGAIVFTVNTKGALI